MTDSENRGLKFRKENPRDHLPKGNNHLLIIGIDDYNHCAKLSNAVSDAKNFAQLMLDKFQFEKDYLVTLFDDKATETNIIHQLRNMAEKVQKTDNLIVYYSGHGHFDELLGEGYWIPVNAAYGQEADYISYSHIMKVIKAIPSHHTLFIVDSCYSGSLFVQTRDNRSLDRFERDPSRWMLASGRNEVVPDGVVGEGSPFAKELLNTLDRYAGEGIKITTLIDKVSTSTVHNSAQTPIGRPLYGVGDQGGEFVFHPKHPQEAAAPSKEEPAASGLLREVQESPSPQPTLFAEKVPPSLKKVKLWRTIAAVTNGLFILFLAFISYQYLPVVIANLIVFLGIFAAFTPKYFKHSASLMLVGNVLLIITYAFLVYNGQMFNIVDDTDTGAAGIFFSIIQLIITLVYRSKVKRWSKGAN